MPAISVIVCTHNPRPDYLHRVLRALDAQTLPKDCWDLLVVDNASDESLADTWDLSWHPRARHVREGTLGVTSARIRGITESRGDLLVYVDDDTTLTPTFLKEASAIFHQYPYLGAFGAGSVEPEFDVLPPPEIRSHPQLLGVRSVSSARWSNNVEDSGSFPWGAGLCIRRQVADLYPRLVGSLRITAVLGRRGMERFSGEDDLFSWVAASAGFGFGIFPQLQVTHLIAADRLNRRHLLRLIQDHAFSQSVLQYVLAGTQPARIDSYRYVRLFLHAVRNGPFSMRCQWAASHGEDRAARFILEKALQQFEQSTLDMELGQ